MARFRNGAFRQYGWSAFWGDTGGGLLAALIALPYGLAMASLMGLPDSPANAVVVDSTSSPPTIYVGTDVGVFSSSTVTPNWTELGPAPISGMAGYLPNVAVTALRLFNFGGSKKLRASTYGRGIWEFTLGPDFQVSFSSNSLTAFVGQTAVFNGTLTALNGYASRVDLSCAAPKPPICSGGGFLSLAPRSAADLT